MTVATTPHIAMAVESIMDCWDESQAMWRRHWKEMPHEGESFDPDQAIYEMGDRMGVWRYFTLRADGQLVGYGCWTVSQSPWHKGDREAGGHSLYIEPEYRKGWTGVKFMRFILATLKAEGVKHVRAHYHIGRPEGVLFKRVGFTDVHIETEMEF